MPSRLAGAAVGLASVAVLTAVLVALSEIAPAEALGVAYVLPVLAVSWRWPGPSGPATAFLGVAAFNWFLLPPTGRFELAKDEDWVALAVLLVTALVAGALSQRARVLTREAEERRTEAQRAAEALSAAADERERLLTEVVETEALRRSDFLKTSLLRAVSHDLRTPLTAILTASEALRSPALEPGEHEELVDDVASEAARLARLVDKLLDLSRLEAASADPRPEWCALPEVLEAAIDGLGLPDGTFRLSVGAELPPLRADAAQLERAFANLLENAARWSGDHDVQVRARCVGERVLVRVVDRGPGIASAEAERIFEPFHRGPGPAHGGSGLGLAIARGFVEANGGRVWVEPVPGQGSTFVVELPVGVPHEVGRP